MAHQLTNNTIASTFEQLWYRGTTEPGGTNNAVQVLTSENDQTDDIGTALYIGTERVGIGTSAAAPASVLSVVASDDDNYITLLRNTHDGGSGLHVQAGIAGDAAEAILLCELKAGTAKFAVLKDGGIVAHSLSGASGKTEVEWDSSTKELSYDSSDAALKTNLQAIPYGLAEINQLKPCMYDMYSWKIDMDEDGNNTGYTKSESPVTIGGIGLIAQEVAEAMPSLVIGDVLKSYKRKELITVMVKAIQELSAKVTALENA